MNIRDIAHAAGVCTDTVRHYEKQGLMGTPQRQPNGYRHYTAADLAQLRFVRGAQSLGFSLAEIREILPQMTQGRLDRAEIERQLTTKLAQIDAHMAQLRTLKKELSATLDALRCPPGQVVRTEHATSPESDSGAGVAVVRRGFSRRH